MSYNSSNSGCLTGAALPPLVVLVVGFLLFILSTYSPTPSSTSIGIDVTNNPAAAILATAALRSSETTPAALSYLSTEPLLQMGVSSLGIAPQFTPEVRFWASQIQDWASGAGLDPNLLATVMQIESCGNPLALSRSGAMGLFQVMPFHFYTSDNPYDPDTNALRAVSYLRRALEAAQGDARLALAGYNGGISVIAKAESSWAEETQRYVYWGYGIYQDALGGASEGQRLQEWYETSGVSLCKDARRRLGMGE
jgi:soluble lytic murein transglycosylase-like protein